MRVCKDNGVRWGYMGVLYNGVIEVFYRSYILG